MTTENEACDCCVDIRRAEQNLAHLSGEDATVRNHQIPDERQQHEQPIPWTIVCDDNPYEECEDEGCPHYGTPHLCRNVREQELKVEVTDSDIKIQSDGSVSIRAGVISMEANTLPAEVEVTIPDVPKTLVELPKSDRIAAYIGLLSALWPTMPDLDNEHKDLAETWIESELEKLLDADVTALSQSSQTADQTPKSAVYTIVVAWTSAEPVDEFVFDSRLYNTPVNAVVTKWRAEMVDWFNQWAVSAKQDFLTYLENVDAHGGPAVQDLAKYVKSRASITFPYQAINGPESKVKWIVEVGQSPSHASVDYTVALTAVDDYIGANVHLANTGVHIESAYVVMPPISLTGDFKRAGSPSTFEAAGDFVERVLHPKVAKKEIPKLFEQAFTRSQFGVLVTIAGASYALESSAVSVMGERLYLKHIATSDSDALERATSIAVTMFDADNNPRLTYLYEVDYEHERAPQIDLTVDEEVDSVAYQETTFTIYGSNVFKPDVENASE